MNKEILIFGDIGIAKSTFYSCTYWDIGIAKNPILIYDVEILISNKISLGEKSSKCFVGYKDDDYKTKFFCIMFQNMSGYIKIFNETKYVYI